LNELVPQKPFRGDIPALNIETSERAARAAIGYAPKGMMKGYARLSTGELTGYGESPRRSSPKEFHLSNVVTFPKKTA
jgi:hypothetical protein